MIIGFTGQKYSGKNTAALAFDGEQASFAYALKYICESAWKVSAQEATKEQEGISLYIARELYPQNTNTHDILFWELVRAYEDYTNITQVGMMPYGGVRQVKQLMDECKAGTLTPRRVWQVVGTNILRKWKADAWIQALASKLDSSKDYVITDCRFQNEVDFIHSLGGMVIRIDRPATDSATIEHASEDVKNLTVDAVVVNDSDIDTLHDRVRLAYLEWTIARPDYWEGIFTQYGS